MLVRLLQTILPMVLPLTVDAVRLLSNKPTFSRHGARSQACEKRCPSSPSWRMTTNIYWINIERAYGGRGNYTAQP